MHPCFSSNLRKELPRAIAAVLAVTAAGFSLNSQAGKIISVPSAFGAAGFGGWNLENVEVLLNGTQGEINSADSWFNENDGSYNFASDSDYTYSGYVYDGAGVVMGQVLAKTYPVGEPSGIKVINGDPGVKNGKPENCIMATSYLEGHYLESDDPKQVTCSSPYQTHKRYKLAMLPNTVPDGELERPVELVFNVIDGEASDYQVFQKINNWTNTRLQGFTVQVGFGVGDGFMTPEQAGVSLENLHLSVPSDIWSPTQLATFSAGLFGPEDKHTGKRGYFDQFTRAGFQIDEYGSEELTDSLHATRTLGSDYANVPPGGGMEAKQFGPWLPNSMLPYGIFFDDDGNPATDAELVAWYGYNPDTQDLGWMQGAGGSFDEIADSQINDWGQNLLYTMGEIDDLVNVGLNYIVSIGDIPYPSFTIRITPTADTSATEPPSYIIPEGETNAGEAYPPSPDLTFVSSVGVVEISPKQEFVVGELLTARVGDADLSDTAIVSISTSSDCARSQDLTLLEQGEGRKVFAAALPEEYSNVPAGCIVTVTYSDTSAEGQVPVTASTTAVDAPVLPPVVADASITDLSVPASLFDGQARNLKVSIINDKASEALATGSVLLTGTDGSEYTAEFTDLKLGGKLKFLFSWTADLIDPEVAQAIEWTVTLRVEDEVGEIQIADDASAFTQVDVKKGKNSKN